MAYLLTFGVIGSLFLASLMLYRYGNIPRQHILVTLSVLTAWCFSFLIVFTIPLDVTSTLYRQCEEKLKPMPESELGNKDNGSNITTTPASNNVHPVECQEPWGMVPASVFPNLWRIIYWSSQFLTWLIMPLMQSYLKAGDFTIKGKLKSALIENAIYYGSYLFICGVLLIYIAVKGVSLDWQKLKAIASSASNTWGLFLLVLLLGYALVEVPRSLWNNAKPGFTLQYAYFKAAKLSTDKAEAEEHVDDVLESLQCISRAVPNNHELRPCVETIMRKVPIELQERASRNFARSGGSSMGATTSTIVPSEKALVRIHKQVIKSLQTLQRTEALWSVQVNTVLHLEDVARNVHSAERRFKTEFPRQRSQLERVCYSATIQWYWECLLKAPFLKALCVVTATMSAMVVWSELTFFCRRPVLSIFANVINVANSNNDFFTIELFSMIVLCYFFYCTYSTILRIRFLNLYYLAPHHQTNEHSLIFSGMLLCRLTPPMCLNFLGLIHMDSHIIQKRIMETYYTQIMGHMDVIGIISNGFNIYFPMCMLAFCLATWFSLGSRALNAMGFQQFLQHETIATELVQEGKDLIAREKRRRQRAEEAIARRRDFSRPDALPSHDYIGKYRGGAAGGGPGSGGVAAAFGSSRTPADGLLRDGDVGYDYAAVASSSALGVPRSLSEEINERFGVSTQMQVGFRGANEQDDEENERRIVGPPPRGLFDDV
ncbi:PREDICTED: LMBR1 domain-containing protein 2 homolog [Drosophila arizonae]|uniref:LMBR1 domain-containing protein 2 homolog n=1 Tax=Drosophila arizonae TaxID=7263 RepID=A0ABM1P922_DROAR|nr:PREDICTED: LMBR1 domain-containing protein 2 homolog [Drosophila arizonae]